MEKNLTIKYRIEDIEMAECSLKLGNINLSDMNIETLKFQYKIETHIEMNKNLIHIKPSIKFIFKGKKLLLLSIIVNYNVQKLTEVFSIDNENHNIDMKVNILPTFLAASYSTLRGVVYVKTLGTPLEKYPIPLINIDTLMDKNGITVEE